MLAIGTLVKLRKALNNRRAHAMQITAAIASHDMYMIFAIQDYTYIMTR